MDKLYFWFTVGLAAAIWIFVFKMVAANQPVQGLKDFAQAL